MATFRVTWEIEIEANSPLEAAKTAREWQSDIRGDSEANQYYVQNEKTLEIVSVDLDEEPDDMVLPVEKYEPLIKN